MRKFNFMIIRKEFGYFDGRGNVTYFPRGNAHKANAERRVVVPTFVDERTQEMEDADELTITSHGDYERAE